MLACFETHKARKLKLELAIKNEKMQKERVFIHQFLNSPVSCTCILVRVFGGGYSGNNVAPFLSVLSSFQVPFIARGMNTIKFKFETVYVSDIRTRLWEPNDLIDWLLNSTIHIFLSHPHQGIPSWSCEDLYSSLHRLRRHPGFPTGINLQCPVFTQDKFRYLNALPSIVTPTIRIQIPKPEIIYKGFTKIYVNELSIGKFELQRILEFMSKNSEGDGWILKLPFATNGEGFKVCQDEDGLVKGLECMFRKYGGRIPYIIMQPRYEYSIIRFY